MHVGDLCRARRYATEDDGVDPGTARCADRANTGKITEIEEELGCPESALSAVHLQHRGRTSAQRAEVLQQPGELFGAQRQECQFLKGHVLEVISMIDEMVTLLGAEQVGDDNKKAYCVKSFDERDDEAKAPARQIAGHKDAIDDYKDQLSSKDAHIEAMQKSIHELDESVRKVSEGRRNQHAEFMTDCQQC